MTFLQDPNASEYHVLDAIEQLEIVHVAIARSWLENTFLEDTRAAILLPSKHPHVQHATIAAIE